MEKQEKFLQIYANLPLSHRKESVVVIDNEPFTWNSAKIENENDTVKERTALEKLEGMGIIK